MKQRIEKLRIQQEEADVLSNVLRPRRHSSYIAAATLLVDVERRGECDGRRQLRERFVFHRERSRPQILAPLGATVSSSSSNSNAKTMREQQPPLALTKGGRSMTPYGAGLGFKQYPSLQAVYDAFGPRWHRLVHAEKQRRDEIQRDHGIVLESMLKELSRTIDIEAMVRPEVAASLGLTITVKLPNYLEEEAAAFARAHDRLLHNEQEIRTIINDTLLRDFAALRRSSVRQLRALQADYEARASAAAMEAALQQELIRSQKEEQVRRQLAQTLEDEVMARFVKIELVEFSERHHMDLIMNAQWDAVLRLLDEMQFRTVMSNHFEIGSYEKTCREAIETEERAQASGSLREASVELDRTLAADALRTRMERVAQREEELRSPREARIFLSCISAIVQSGVDSLLDAFRRTLQRELQEMAEPHCLEATPLSFLQYCEATERSAMYVAHDEFQEDAAKCFEGPHASIWLERALSRHHTGTPASDVAVDPSGNRSVVSSSQRNGRRPLWSAGGGSNGNGGRSSRVPTGEGVRATYTPVARTTPTYTPVSSSGLPRGGSAATAGSRSAVQNFPPPLVKLDL